MPWAFYWSDAVGQAAREPKAERKTVCALLRPPCPSGKVDGPCGCDLEQRRQCEVVTGAGAAG